MGSDPYLRLFDQERAARQAERAKEQRTLGELIQWLEAMPVDGIICGLDSPHSYFGYPEDLAFVPHYAQRVGEVLQLARNCLVTEFTSYAGQLYRMTRGTPVWLARPYRFGVRVQELAVQGGICMIGFEACPVEPPPKHPWLRPFLENHYNALPPKH